MLLVAGAVVSALVGVLAGSGGAALLLRRAFDSRGGPPILPAEDPHELRWSPVIEASASAMVMVDRDGTIHLVNGKAEALFGYTREELVGARIEILVPLALRTRHPELVSGFFNRPQARPMGAGRDLFGLRKDGVEVPVEIGLNPIETPEGMFTLASIIDITERKRQEDALRRSAAALERQEQRLRQVVEASASAMLMIDSDRVIQLANRRAEELFGYTREELLGQPIELLVPEGLRERHPEQVRAFFARPETRTMGGGRDLYALRKDGVETPVEIGLNPIEAPEGLFTLASIIDITERKRQEDELRRSNAELEQFAYIASHDLQEPLRMVASYTELLAERYRGRLDEKADRYIHYASDGAKRMQRLIADLLTYSRVGSQGRPLVAVDANAVLAGVGDMFEAQLKTVDGMIEAASLPQVLADEGQLYQLFQNLIGNAIKFRGEAPLRITVGAAQERGQWVFCVRDNGMGLDMHHASRIFDMFQRLHERGKYEGSGIGLAISKRIVERHGGRLWVESEPGQGAAFFFTLQRA